MRTGRTSERSGGYGILPYLAIAAIAPAVLGTNAAGKPGSRSVAVGEVSWTPPAQIAALSAQQSSTAVEPDPVQGGWAVLSNELIRINEDGSAKRVPLPAALQGVHLTFIPLRDGWAVATNQVFPGGRAEKDECEFASGRCGVTVVAQLSPNDRWTRAHQLPHSSGDASSGLGGPPVQAIETEGRIELAWCQECEGPSIQAFWIALARPGGLFGKAHPVGRALRTVPQSEEVETFRGKFYLRARFGPHGEFSEGRHVVEREIGADGRLGRPHFMSSPLIRFSAQPLAGRDPLAGRNNSEELVFSESDEGRLGVARRRGWRSTLGPPRFIASHAQPIFDSIEAPDDWLLIVAEALTQKRWQLITAEVSPGGRVQPTQGIEDNPVEARGTYKYTESIDNAGQALIASTYESEPTSIWLHGGTQQCPTFSRTLFPPFSRPTYETTGEDVPGLFAGAHDVFHVVWVNREHQLESTIVHVGCTAGEQRVAPQPSRRQRPSRPCHCSACRAHCMRPPSFTGPAQCGAFYLCHVIAKRGHLAIFTRTPRPPREPIRYRPTFAIWLPTRRISALGDVDEEGYVNPQLTRYALAGEYLAYTLPVYVPHAEGLRWQIIRLNVRSAQQEKARRNVHGCLVEDADEDFDAHKVEDIAVTSAGRVAWIFGSYSSSPPNYWVCDLPPGSCSPVLLASSKTVAPKSLGLTRHRLSWSEGGQTRIVPLR